MAKEIEISAAYGPYSLERTLHFMYWI